MYKPTEKADSIADVLLAMPSPGEPVTMTHWNNYAQKLGYRSFAAYLATLPAEVAKEWNSTVEMSINPKTPMIDEVALFGIEYLTDEEIEKELIKKR